MQKKHLLTGTLLAALLLAGCSSATPAIPASPTAVPPTASLPPTFTPPPTQTPLPPPTATVTPVEGLTLTQLNARAEPSTTGTVLGIIPVNTLVQIIGTDPGGNWWQILYPAAGQGEAGKAWVTAQYISTAGRPEVPVIGGGGTNPQNGPVAVIQQQLNIRSGPGTSFNSLGTLNPLDVVTLIGKDPNGAWLQISFPAGPEGKGWVNAAFVKADGVDGLPIIGDAGQVLGTGTPVDTPLPPSPTVVPASNDNDSAQAPAATVTFSPTSTRSLQFSGDVSAPTGDTEDWVQFTPDTTMIRLDLTCQSPAQAQADLLLNGQLLASAQCNTAQLVTVQAGAIYQVRVWALSDGSFSYNLYTLTVSSR